MRVGNVCRVCAVAAALVLGHVARADDVHVVVSGGLAAAYKELAPVFEKQSHHRLLTEWGASMGATPTSVPMRLDRGEAIDVVIIAREAIDPLLGKGQVAPGSSVDLVRSKIAMAVRQGAPVPDIGSVEAFKRTLLNAKSVAWSDSASGVYLRGELFKRLGIDAEMAAKGRTIPGTPVGEVVASGEYELGFQQYSELLPVAGIRIVGTIPDEVQKITVFSAAITTTAKSPAAARELIRFLASEQSAPTLRASGLDPLASGTSKPDRSRSYVPPLQNLSPTVQGHVDLAYLALNGAVSSGHLQAVLFGIPRGTAQAGPPQPRPTPVALPATRVFDQLYYLGHQDVSAWALVTTDGIVIIDSLNTAEDAEQYIEQGLRSVGLDPARITTLIVTHGHPDHYGGSRYLQQKFHARVLMSATEWDFAAKNVPQNPKASLAMRDQVATDDGIVTVGRTPIHTYVTPGHTPGTLSLVFPVTDQGRSHTVSFFGGYGTQFIDRDVSAGGFATMRESLLRFARLSLDAGADVILANHTFNDASDLKVSAVRAGSTTGVNPWVAGRETVQRFYIATIEAVQALEAYFSEHPGSPTLAPADRR